MTAPRVRTVVDFRNEAVYSYKGAEVSIHRSDDGRDWYIIVTAPNGARDYDGWWRGSAGRTKREALLEGLRGACVWPTTLPPADLPQNSPSAKTG